MPEAFGILAPRYVLGEEECKVDTLASRKAVLERYKMPDRHDLWGWDAYRKTHRNRTELAHDSARATLAQGGVAAADIDALIVCCGDGLNYYAQNRFVSELSERLDLRCDFVAWIGGAGCASPFSAVKIARALVVGGAHRNVLVITVDKVDDDDARFQRYGVFSDGACSFVARGAGEIDYAVTGVEASTSTVSLRDGGQDLAEKCRLIQAVFKRLAGAATFPFAGSAFFGSNVFLPIQQLELSVMPVKGLVAYRRNTTRYGHCSGGDPFINLVDYYAEADDNAPATSVMASSAYGHFGAILLERRLLERRDAAAGVSPAT